MFDGFIEILVIRLIHTTIVSHIFEGYFLYWLWQLFLSNKGLNDCFSTQGTLLYIVPSL